MRKIISWLAVVLITSALSACQKEVVPVSRFSYEVTSLQLRQYDPSIIPAQEPIQFRNLSSQAVAYQWSFGDGSTSTDKEPITAYRKSGTYTVSLTTTSSTGKQTVSTQSINVVDRVLKRIIVSRLKWNAFGALSSWDDVGKQADLQVELGTLPTDGQLTQPSSLLYRSDQIERVANTSTNFIVPLTQKVILNPDVLPTNFLLNVYGNDGCGSQLVYSTMFGGVGYSFRFVASKGLYEYKTGLLGTAISLEVGFQ